MTEFFTSDFYVVLNQGGMMLVGKDDIIYTNAGSTEDIAKHEKTIFLSPDEILKISDIVQKNRSYLGYRQKELDVYFNRVAQAWLDELGPFLEANQSAFHFTEDEGWWEIRNAANHCLTHLTNEKKNTVINEWYEQTINNDNFPQKQQEELLERYFRNLYFQKYPERDNY
jgi:hypothetical protein